MVLSRTPRRTSFGLVSIGVLLAVLTAGAAAFATVWQRRGEVRVESTGCAREQDDARVLARQVETLRSRLAEAELRLASVRSHDISVVAVAPPADDEAAKATSDVAGATPEDTSAARDQTLARVAEVQAGEIPDQRWASEAELGLRALAPMLDPSASIESVHCAGTLCRVELGHGSSAIPPKRLQAFMAGAEELFSQATVHSDARNRTTVVFARAGASLPDAEGGGS